MPNIRIEHIDRVIMNQLARIEWKLDRNWYHIHKGTRHMSKAFDDLEIEVARNRTVTQSVLALVKKFAEAAAGSTDPKLRAFADELKTNQDEVVAAVLAHTPVQPEPPVPPLPPDEVTLPVDPTTTE